jgi:hypothetical protein
MTFHWKWPYNLLKGFLKSTIYSFAIFREKTLVHHFEFEFWTVRHFKELKLYYFIPSAFVNFSTLIWRTWTSYPRLGIFFLNVSLLINMLRRFQKNSLPTRFIKHISVPIASSLLRTEVNAKQHPSDFLRPTVPESISIKYQYKIRFICWNPTLKKYPSSFV